jgi:hypothetical protein
MLLFIVLALLVKLTRSLIPLLATEVGLDATGCMRAIRRGANAYPRCTEEIAALRGITSSLAEAALAKGLDSSSEDSGAPRNSSSIAALLDATGCMRARRRGANAYPDEPVKDRAPFGQALERANLVSAHETAVALDICCEDCDEASADFRRV